MQCPCGGVTSESTYSPGPKDGQPEVKNVTNTCNGCGRRMVLVFDGITGRLIERRG